ncbi:MAG: hypothetical protein COA68_16820 [Oceanobacter sp.]|nr:MAG: hypothetical protein COA68_16820 [Oceanobacter sp.]
MMTTGPECVRGRKQNAAPLGAGRTACGTERVISPAHHLGALRGFPADGLAGDSAAAQAQRKAFPSNICNRRARTAATRMFRLHFREETDAM